MDAEVLEQALRLSASERLELIGALWDTLSEKEIPVTAEERALLDVRLADLEANPDDQSPWPEVRARLERRHWSLLPFLQVHLQREELKEVFKGGGGTARQSDQERKCFFC